jgi:hypothetical protein
VRIEESKHVHALPGASRLSLPATQRASTTKKDHDPTDKNTETGRTRFANMHSLQTQSDLSAIEALGLRFGIAPGAFIERIDMMPFMRYPV